MTRVGSQRHSKKTHTQPTATVDYDDGHTGFVVMIRRRGSVLRWADRPTFSPNMTDSDVTVFPPVQCFPTVFCSVDMKFCFFAPTFFLVLIATSFF